MGRADDGGGHWRAGHARPALPAAHLLGIAAQAVAGGDGDADPGQLGDDGSGHPCGAAGVLLDLRPGGPDGRRSLRLDLYLCAAGLGRTVMGIKYYRQLQDETQRALAARAMAHQSQLKMLRYQLNPHFLFNTLNAISTLVLDGDDVNANRMVTDPSGLNMDLVLLI
jgi:Histidine kinase